MTRRVLIRIVSESLVDGRIPGHIAQLIILFGSFFVFVTTDSFKESYPRVHIGVMVFWVVGAVVGLWKGWFRQGRERTSPRA